MEPLMTTAVPPQADGTPVCASAPPGLRSRHDPSDRTPISRQPSGGGPPPPGGETVSTANGVAAGVFRLLVFKTIMKVVKVFSSRKEFVVGIRSVSQVSWVFLERWNSQAVVAGVCRILLDGCGWSG
ncbi:hypothetical protein LTR67_000563 [Exophiala xenobiotica]